MSATIEFRPAHGTRHEVRGVGTSFVATKTITVRNEYGKDETLKAGVTFVHDARHFLVTEYPHLFAREGARTQAKRPAARPRRSAPATRPSEAKRPMWTPLVRLSTSNAPTLTVQVRRDAYLSMTDQAFTQRGRVETCGALFGIPAKDGPPTIRRAGSPGPKARATESSVHVDCDHVRRKAAELERRDAIDRWVGSWHTHPSGDGQPSRGDLQFFAWDCREWHHMGRSMDHYIALILTPNLQPVWGRGAYLSWAKPTIHAWHMHAVADDQFICTRAEVERC
jgi:proteasome lid subunit RPN8/RPN11